MTIEARQHGEYEEKRLGRPFTVEAADDAEGSFSGHGAVFNDLHETSSWSLPPDWQDRIIPGAFADTLAMHKKRGTMPAMLYMHDRGNVVGAWRSMEEDASGLKVKGQVATEARAPSGAPLYSLLKMGALNAMSIGFRVTKSTLDDKKKIRDILAVDVGELSIVDIPGIASARISDVKSADPGQLKRQIEEALRDAGLSRTEAKAFIAEGFKALRDAASDDEGKTEKVPPALRDAAANGDIVARIKALAAAVHP